MTPSRTIRVLFLGSMLGSIVVVLAWAGFISWRKWPEWRAVREMRAAVEANEPGRFLDAVEAVDKLGVAEAAADEIAALRHHPDPRVRMYAVMALTIFRPRGPAEAKELIELFDDPDEDIQVCRAAAYSLALLGEDARDAEESFRAVTKNRNDPRWFAAVDAIAELPLDETVSIPPLIPGGFHRIGLPPRHDMSRRYVAEFLVNHSDERTENFQATKDIFERHRTE